MRRRLFNIASGLSLLLCVAVALLWVRSYLRSDTIERYGRDYEGDALHRLMVESYQGRVALWHEDWQRGGPAGVTIGRSVGEKSYVDAGDPVDVKLSFAGFRWIWYSHTAAARDGWVLIIPLWAIALPLAIYAGLSLRYRWSNSQYRFPGLCPICGYDLRATPDRCPECGTTIPTDKAAKIP